MDVSILTLIRQGGLLMWPLILCSLFGMLILIERTIYLHKGQIQSSKFIAGVKNLLRKRRLLEALTLCQDTPGPVAPVIKAVLLQVGQPESVMRGAAQAEALVQIPALERRVGTLAAIARLAPLIGLIGTLLGINQVLYTQHQMGAYVQFSELSGGFAQALITSIFGLLIAALAHAAHHFLYGRVRALVHDIEFCAHDIMQFILRDMPDEPALATDTPAPATTEAQA